MHIFTPNVKVLLPFYNQLLFFGKTLECIFHRLSQSVIKSSGKFQMPFKGIFFG